MRRTELQFPTVFSKVARLAILKPVIADLNDPSVR
jgi:hypothetical protein